MVPPATTRPAGGMSAGGAVDGKTLRGSGDADTPARHVLAAVEHTTGAVLAQTDVEETTNEITRFVPLLEQVGDLRGVVVTADALHCQRDHVTYLAKRGAHWVLTVKRNQPTLYAQLAALPWRAVPDGDRVEDRGHGRREIRTIKVCTLAGGIDFPHAAQAMRIRRRRRSLDQPRRWSTETVYAITDFATPPGKTQPTRGLCPQPLGDREQGPLGAGCHLRRGPIPDPYRHRPHVMAALRNLAISALRLAGATNIAAATRHHSRNHHRPLTLLRIT